MDADVARNAIEAEAQAVSALTVLAPDIVYAARLLLDSDKIVVTGVGKAGIIARKLAATLTSLGSSAIFLHPTDALHGDLGHCIDIIGSVILSHSGMTDEILRLLPYLPMGISIAITSTRETPLTRAATCSICYGPVHECEPLGLAPTVSTTCMLVICDSLAMTLAHLRGVTAADFAASHPAGALGRNLTTVDQLLRPAALVQGGTTLAEALAQTEVGRRSGAMLVVNAEGKLLGIFTDADFRRLMLKTRDALYWPMSRAMVCPARSILRGELASKALAICQEYRIDELPVIDEAGKPVGVIDAQDLLSLFGGQ